jgi:hypothetical protein
VVRRRRVDPREMIVVEFAVRLHARSVGNLLRTLGILHV